MAAASVLGLGFSLVPDKYQARSDLHLLTVDKNENVRKSAALGLIKAFPELPDKDQTWQDLVRL
jgi:HEAT repeat protein